jgi:TPR repeat protein
VKNFRRIVRAVLTCATLPLVLAGCATGALIAVDQPQALQMKAASGDKAALEALLSAALEGNVLAQFFLGVSYDNGEGVAQDYAQAAQWYRKAAEQGLAEAQNIVGVFYALGSGVAPQLSGII